MQPKRQKLLNVKCGPKMAEDDTLLSAVKLPKVVMMMGSTEASIDEISAAAEAAPEVLDDFDVGLDEAIDVKDKEENLEKLRKRVEKYHVEPSTPRERARNSSSWTSTTPYSITGPLRRTQGNL